MPEIRFTIRWPDGELEQCYSPSLVVKDYLTPGEDYLLSDFLERSRAALATASDRVRAKYGHPCALALAQLARIEAGCARFADRDRAHVSVASFEE
jgi:uncharacterized repeat protein (TIGR04042 family)